LLRNRYARSATSALQAVAAQIVGCITRLIG
jgi:hypothetical protein